MAQVFSTTSQQAENQQNATTGINPDSVNQWLNLAPSFTNAIGNILNVFKRQDVSDVEREMAVQQQFYSLQQQQAAKQQKTYIVAGGVCLLAILLTVYFTRKH